jgi:Flp pilus assembly protein TadD
MSGTDAYTAYQEGSRLLAAGSLHAAALLLARARDLEPEKGSIREALARAYFGTGRFAAAEAEFRAALDIDPVNDYAYFGVGVCRLRAGDSVGARRNLHLAAAMRPDNDDYRQALAQVDTDRGEG